MFVFNRIVVLKLLTYLIVIVTYNCIHLIYWKYIIRECLIYGVSLGEPGCELGVDFVVGCGVVG